MFSKVDYVMVNVSDMRRSVEFYRDTLGLRLKFESPAWSESGIRLAVCVDPDGLSISFAEPMAREATGSA